MIEQGSNEWLQERCGCATASRFIDIIAVGKNGNPLKAREDYKWTLIGEQFYNTPTESFSAKSTEWGKDLEPFARQAYEVETGSFIDPSGFVKHPTIAHCGASPDGLVGKDGGIEIKCPRDRRVHLQTWRNGMPLDHLPQVQGNIWVNDLKWIDFISYDPRAPEGFRLYVQRVMRDDKYILALQSHVQEFLQEVENEVRGLHERQKRLLRGSDSADGAEDYRPVRSEPVADADGVLPRPRQKGKRKT